MYSVLQDPDLSCAHQGIADVRTHIAGKNHQRLARGMEARTQLSFTPDPLADKVSRQSEWALPFVIFLSGFHVIGISKRTVHTVIVLSVLSVICRQIIRAEVKMANFIVEHNLPLAISDHLTPLVRDIFSNSMVAKKYASHRTKATSILNFVIGPHFRGTWFTITIYNSVGVYVCV